MADITRLVNETPNHKDWEDALRREGEKVRNTEKDGNRFHELHANQILTLWPNSYFAPSAEVTKYYLWILQRTANSTPQWNKVITLYLDEPEYLPKAGIFDVDNYDALFFPFIADSKPTPEGSTLRPAFTFIALFPKIMFTNGEIFAVFFDAQRRWTRSHSDDVSAAYSKYALACKKHSYPIKFHCWTVPSSADNNSPPNISDSDSIALSMMHARCIFGNEPPPPSPVAKIEQYRFNLVRDLVLNRINSLYGPAISEDGEVISVPELVMKCCTESFVTDKHAEKQATIELPNRLECRPLLTTRKTKVQEFNAATHLCLENLFRDTLDCLKDVSKSVLENMRARSPVSVRMYKRYLMLLMKESMEFGGKRYNAKVWVDVPEIRLATSTLDLYSMFDYLLFPFEDTERKGYCTLIIADLVTMRSRGFIPLLYYDLMGKFVRDDVSNVVSLIKGDRKNKDLDPKNMKIEHIRTSQMVSDGAGDSALYCMFHAHNLLLQLDKEQADDPLVFRTATQDWFRGHMADELEKSSVMAFAPTGQQPIDLTPRPKEKDLTIATGPELKIPTTTAANTLPSPRSPTSPFTPRSRSPGQLAPNSGSGTPSPVPSPTPSPIPENEQVDKSFIKLEQLRLSPSFNSMEQRMLNLLARNPDQILFTRPAVVNDQLNPAALITRQIMQMLPGNVVSEPLFNWYCGLIQELARKNSDWRSSIIFTPEVFSAWRAKKNVIETIGSVGPSNPFTIDSVVLFPVCESAMNWSLLVSKSQPGPSGLVVNLLFFDPNARFNDAILSDCVSLVRSYYASRGGDPNTLNIVTRKVELPDDCCSPNPCDCAVEIMSIVRSVITRDKLGLPKRLIPAFRIHTIRELLNNDIISLK